MKGRPVDLRPDVNDPVVLRDQAACKHHSRVEDLGPGTLTVAMPLDLPAEHDFDPSAELLVTWASSRGIVVLPTRLLDSHDEGGLRLWSLAVTGKGWIEQQRRFVRVPATGALTLRSRGDQPGVATVTGHLVDVSEAAVRCLVDAATADELLADGVAVTAGFQLGDHEFAIAARVGSHRPSARPTELAELVVQFDEPVGEADVLRKQIYAHQLRTLRVEDDVR